MQNRLSKYLTSIDDIIAASTTPVPFSDGPPADETPRVPSGTGSGITEQQPLLIDIGRELLQSVVADNIRALKRNGPRMTADPASKHVYETELRRLMGFQAWLRAVPNPNVMLSCLKANVR